MAFKPKSIWRLAKIVNFHLGLPSLVPNGCGFASDLRFFRKWECCSAGGAGVLAQTRDSQSTGFQENLNLLSTEKASGFIQYLQSLQFTRVTGRI